MRAPAAFFAATTRSTTLASWIGRRFSSPRLPVESCARSLFMRSSACLTVANMSSWKRGLLRWRSAFLSISESCATRFLRSCTTNAAILLNDSNLRASSSASEACTWARKLPTCRAAVFSRSRTSQFSSILARGVARTTNPVSSSSAITGTTSQAAASCRSPDGSRRQPRRQRRRAGRLRRLQVDDPAGLGQEGGEGAVPGLARVERGHVPARRLRIPVTFGLQPDGAAGTLDQVGERLDRALRAAHAGIAARQQPGEAQPFMAIVVAVGEEVLVDEHSQPGAQRAGRKEPRKHQQRGEDEPDLECLAPAAAEVAYVVAGRGDRQQIQAAAQKRGRM